MPSGKGNDGEAQIPGPICPHCNRLEAGAEAGGLETVGNGDPEPASAGGGEQHEDSHPRPTCAAQVGAPDQQWLGPASQAECAEKTVAKAAAVIVERAVAMGDRDGDAGPLSGEPAALDRPRIAPPLPG